MKGGIENNPNYNIKKIKGFNTKLKIKRIKIEIQTKYIINFNLRTKLKPIQTYTIEIRIIQNNKKPRDRNEVAINIGD